MEGVWAWLMMSLNCTDFHKSQRIYKLLEDNKDKEPGTFYPQNRNVDAPEEQMDAVMQNQSSSGQTSPSN